ncbi:MAG: hypothetical protein RL328_1169, partial [Acidobacteriota bacterium]
MRVRYRLVLVAIFSISIASAHVVSISNGELTVTGRTAEYVLRMPAYEVEQMPKPEQTLLDAMRFGDGQRIEGSCTKEGSDLVCHSRYVFPKDLPDKIEVGCSLYRVTVPNHIHMLYARQGANADQRVFDQNQPVIEMRFHPPSFTESLTRDSVAGAMRFLRSFSALLFLLAIVLAARDVRETAILGGLALLAQWIMRPLVPFLPLALSPDFLESLMALTTAYLAGETLFLPESRVRWAIVPILGLVHGLPFTPFPPLDLAGAQAAEATLLGIFAVGAARTPASWRKPAAA